MTIDSLLFDDYFSETLPPQTASVNPDLFEGVLLEDYDFEEAEDDLFGLDYDSAQFIWPNHAAPGVPVDDSVIASALEAAYFCARRQNQLLVSEAGAFNSQRPNAALSTDFIVVSTDFVSWHDSYAYIPKLATHLCAHVAFAALPLTDCQAHVRLGAYDPADTLFASPVTGTVVVQSVNAGVWANDQRGLLHLEGLKGDDFSVGGLSNEDAVYESEVEVAVSFYGSTRIFIEGFLDGVGAPYRPLFWSIWWEIRSNV